MSTSAKIMSEKHIIRLRGGWRMLLPTPGQIISLPFQSLDSIRNYEEISIQRAFQRPNSGNSQLIVNLCWQNASGMKLICLNPDIRINLPLEKGQIQLPETEQRYLLTIEIESKGMELDRNWGEFWLEVSEADQAKPGEPLVFFPGL